jgi:hypothetical protein
MTNMLRLRSVKQSLYFLLLLKNKKYKKLAIRTREGRTIIFFNNGLKIILKYGIIITTEENAKSQAIIRIFNKKEFPEF